MKIKYYTGWNLWASQENSKIPLNALSYGEDFEILLTIKKDKFKEIEDKISLYEIGSVTSSGQIQMINKKEK